MGDELLTHIPLVPQICVGELGQHWFRKWLVASSASSHYLNQCCIIISRTLGSKLEWNSNWNTKLIIHENAFENIVREMATILFRGRWVNPCRAQIISGSRRNYLHFFNYRSTLGNCKASSWKTKTCCSHMVSIIAADDLAMQGARKSAALSLTYSYLGMFLF